MKNSYGSNKAAKTITTTEDNNFVQSLRRHGQVKETTNPDAKLGPGQTHLLIKKPGATDVLVEKRKSFF